MATAAEWAKAYGRQANSDFQTFELMEIFAAPMCHRLQFLQMTCEKLCKAHLCDLNTDPQALQASHQYIKGPLPVVLRKTYLDGQRDPRKGVWAMTHIKHLSQEIELLSPSVNRVMRPDNCEYPWEDAAGNLHVPIDWTFMPSSLLENEAGRLFLKLIRQSLERFT